MLKINLTIGNTNIADTLGLNKEVSETLKNKLADECIIIVSERGEIKASEIVKRLYEVSAPETSEELAYIFWLMPALIDAVARRRNGEDPLSILSHLLKR